MRAFVGECDCQTLETIRLLLQTLRRFDRLRRLHIHLDIRPTMYQPHPRFVPVAGPQRGWHGILRKIFSGKKMGWESSIFPTIFQLRETDCDGKKEQLSQGRARDIWSGIVGNPHTQANYNPHARSLSQSQTKSCLDLMMEKPSTSWISTTCSSKPTAPSHPI